jgi:predicted anti-sigma-YlaC factor YlaD
MKSCAQAEAVEMLLLAGDRSLWVRDHLATCEACREEAAWLDEERALFARRAALAPPPPYLDMERLERMPARGGRGAQTRAVPALLALAACVAAFAGSGRLVRGYGVGEEAARAGALDERAASNASSAALDPEALMSTGPRHALALSFADEPMACALPASISFRRAQQSTDDGFSLMTNDRATCEDIAMSSLRVTSSFATP